MEKRESARFFGEDTRLNIRFFVVKFNTKGEISSIDIQNDPEITEKQAKDYGIQIYGEKKQKGWEGGYRYKLSNTENGDSIIFVEGSMNCSVTRMLLLSVGGVLIVTAMIIILLIVILSKRAVRPVAESYEKQKQFITDVNHELKTPLTLIMTNLDIVEEELGKSEWLDDIRSEGMRMNALVNKLVFLTRMDEETSDVLCEWFNLSKSLLEIVEEFQILADEKGEALHVQIEEGIDYYGDEQGIRRLFSILLENAIKYCDPGGEIAIFVSKKRHPHIRVENNYQNVKEIELDKLFDRFYRSDKARTFTGGFGIGLSIAKAIVRKHHGEISAYQKSDNKIGFKIILK